MSTAQDSDRLDMSMKIDALEKQLGEADAECERLRLLVPTTAQVMVYQSLLNKYEESQSKLHAFESAMEREKKPEWSESLKALSERLNYYAECDDKDAPTYCQNLRRAARELRYMADSFTLKANFVPAELRIKELEAENKELRLKVAQLDAFIHKHG